MRRLRQPRHRPRLATAKIVDHLARPDAPCGMEIEQGAVLVEKDRVRTAHVQFISAPPGRAARARIGTS